MKHQIEKVLVEKSALRYAKSKLQRKKLAQLLKREREREAKKNIVYIVKPLYPLRDRFKAENYIQN